MNLLAKVGQAFDNIVLLKSLASCLPDARNALIGLHTHEQNFNFSQDRFCLWPQQFELGTDEVESESNILWP